VIVDKICVAVERDRRIPFRSVVRSSFLGASPFIVLSALPRTASGLSTLSRQCSVLSKYVPTEYR
jgi:hypothetical protein